MNKKALKLFPYVYLLLVAIPLAFTTVSIVQEVALYNLLSFVALVAFSVLTIINRRKMMINR